MESSTLSNFRLTTLPGSATLRLLVLGSLCLLMLVPLSVVRDVVKERRALRAEAIESIAAGWGGEQTLLGPALVLRFRCEGPDAEGSLRHWRETAVVLPESLETTGRARTERRSRGLHEIPVYSAAMRVRGEFAAVAWSELPIDCSAPQLDQAELALAVSDPRGIARLSDLDWRGTPVAWRSGNSLGDCWSTGVSAALESDSAQSELASVSRFEFEIELRGIDRIAFAPLGRSTQVTLTSDWPTPSFDGAFLPADRATRSDGSEATWRVSSLSRPFPQAWQVGTAPDLGKWTFGVRWFVVADSYLMTDRSLKYGFLFVALTLMLFFLFELAGDARLHPVQYTLVGGAVCVFYLLLLSFSEGRGFGPAYFVASAATTLQIALYARAILGARRRALVLAGALATLYGGLYALIGAEELALLLGSVLLFAALALLMWKTRSVDWSRKRGVAEAS